MNVINLNTLRASKEIRFSPEINNNIYKASKTFMESLVYDTNVLKIIYKELSNEEIIKIFLGDTKFQSMIKANDILDIVCEMNAVDFNDGEMKNLDSGQHHGKKAKADIQKEKELQIKDLEGPSMAGVVGPDR